MEAKELAAKVKEQAARIKKQAAEGKKKDGRIAEKEKEVQKELHTIKGMETSILELRMMNGEADFELSKMREAQRAMEEEINLKDDGIKELNDAIRELSVEVTAWAASH